MYIVIEGINGTGKTTQAKLLKEYLEEKGYNTQLISEPTHNMTWTLIRKQLRNKENKNNTEQELLSLLFASDRLTQKEEIMKAKGSLTDMLVSDRSYYSSIAYQDVGGVLMMIGFIVLIGMLHNQTY